MANISIKDLWILQLDPLKRFLIEADCRFTREVINTEATQATIDFDLNDNVEVFIKNTYVIFIDYKNAKAFKVFLEDFTSIEVY